MSHAYHFFIAAWRAKEAESARVKHWRISLAILAALAASIALLLCAANAFAGGAGAMLIMTSEALDKELVLWSHCIKLRPDAPSDVKQECADDKRVLIKRLNKFAKFCDETIDDPEGAGKLQARTARFYERFLEYCNSPELKKKIADDETRERARLYNNPDSPYKQPKLLDAAPELKAETSAIVKERARLVKENPDGTFQKVGLLGDESIEWLTLTAQ